MSLVDDELVEIEALDQNTEEEANLSTNRSAIIERLKTEMYATRRPPVTLGVFEPPTPKQQQQEPLASPRPSEFFSSPPAVKKLGTFKGVFVPCLQNILGVILFLRLTWITAQGGTYAASAIIVICAMSTFLTALSLSGIATNGRVAAGGPYFLVSRNLGPEVGTAVGLMFYLGTTIAASLYVLGAVESLFDGFSQFDSVKWEMRSVTAALGLMTVLACIVSVGVKQVNKAAEVFLAVVLYSVLSSLVGVALFAANVRFGALSQDDRSPRRTTLPKYRKDPDTGIVPDFQVLLSIFYPSVTGIMAGSNRSGVLATPSQSIPVGTLSAIAVTTTLYLVFVWLFGYAVNRGVLYDKQLVVALVAWPSVTVVKIGIVCSTVGAALQSLTGAPRLLYAIAKDGTLPFLTRWILGENDKNHHAKRSSGFSSSSSSSSPRNEASLPSPVNSVDHPDNERKSFFSGGGASFSLGRRHHHQGTTMSGGLELSEHPETTTTSFRNRVRRRSSKLLSMRRNMIRLTSKKRGGGGVGDDDKEDPLASGRRPPEGDVEDPSFPAAAATCSSSRAGAPSSPSPSEKKDLKLQQQKKKDADVTPFAVVVTWFIASLPCFAGNLTLITPIVTMLFLLMYASINAACFFLAYLKSPGFRPTWRYFHWSTALLGFLWCVGLMFAMSWYLALVALTMGATVGYFVRKEGVNKDWGDSVAGLRFQLARDQLLALTDHSTFYHAKNWRPQLLVLVKADAKFNPIRPELLEIASSLKKGQGLLIAYALIDAEATHGAVSRAVVADAATEVLRLHLNDHQIQGFPRAVVYRHRGSRAGTHIAAGDAHLLEEDGAFPTTTTTTRGEGGKTTAITLAAGGVADDDDDEAKRQTGPGGDDDDDDDSKAGNASSSSRPPATTMTQRTPKSKLKKDKALIVDDRRARMDAMLSAAQSCGIGALRPNTVLLGWPTAKGRSNDDPLRPQSPSSDRARRVDFAQLLRDLSSMRKALIVLKGGASLVQGGLGGGGQDFLLAAPPGGPSQDLATVTPAASTTTTTLTTTKTIDVWWVVQDGGLLLLLPWLMQRSKTFMNCRIRLFAVMTGLFAHHWNATHGGAAPVLSAVDDEDTEATLLRRFEAFVEKLVADLRIDAEINAVAGLDFVQAASHVYRDTLGLRGSTTYLQQLHSHRHRTATPTSARRPPDSPRFDQRPSFLKPTFDDDDFEKNDDEKNAAFAANAAANAADTSTTSDPPRDPPPRPSSAHQMRLPDVVLQEDHDAAGLFPELLGFAEALNGKMREHSNDASLIVTNLPYMTHLPPQFFVDYVDTMTDALDAVMLIRGSGMEVVTKYG